MAGTGSGDDVQAASIISSNERMIEWLNDFTIHSVRALCRTECRVSTILPCFQNRRGSMSRNEQRHIIHIHRRAFTVQGIAVIEHAKLNADRLARVL